VVPGKKSYPQEEKNFPAVWVLSHKVVAMGDDLTTTPGHVWVRGSCRLAALAGHTMCPQARRFGGSL
jgi:hypothetical protein